MKNKQIYSLKKKNQKKDPTDSQTWLHMEIEWGALKITDVWVPIYRLYSNLIDPIMSFKGNFLKN